MSAYVVGDLHGCYSEWMQLKNRIEQEDKNATFILVGDIIDRGKETYQLAKWAMENITDTGKYQMVLGNHEMMKILWLEQNRVYIKHYTNLELNNKNIVKVYRDENDYNFYANIDKHMSNEDATCNFIIEFTEWLKTLHYYKDIEVNRRRFIVVHADFPDTMINTDYTIKDTITRDDKIKILDTREVYGFKGIPGVILVHGHTPTINYTNFLNMQISFNEASRYFGKIHEMPNRYNVDCGLVFRDTYSNANLGVLRLDDLKPIYLY